MELKWKNGKIEWLDKEHQKRWLIQFGKEVRKRMIDRELNMNEMAEMVGVSYRYLVAMFVGLRPGYAYIPKIARVLDMDINKITVLEKEPVKRLVVEKEKRKLWNL